jgi:hypothetical protein
MVRLDMSLYKLSVLRAPEAFDAAHSFGTCAFGIFGSSGPLVVPLEEDAPPVSEDIDEGDGAEACSFGGANRFGRSAGGAGSLEKGLDGSLAGADWVLVSFEDSVELVCGLEAKNVDWALKALLELLFSGWKVWEKRPELVLGCAALNRPACGFSTSVVFAGCGVLKPRKRLDRSASGAFDVAVPEGFWEAAEEFVSLFCDVPKMLKSGVLAAGGGLASDENKLALGVSAEPLALCSGALMLPNSAGFGVPALSSGSSCV